MGLAKIERHDTASLAGLGHALKRVGDSLGHRGMAGLTEIAHVGGKIGRADEKAVNAFKGRDIVKCGETRAAFDLQDQADFVVCRLKIVTDPAEIRGTAEGRTHAANAVRG